MVIPSRLEPIAAAVRRVAESDPRIAAVYLFGSQADGSATAASDVDLGVLFAEPADIAERVRLEARLSDALGKEADLVDVGSCNAFLALEIISGERLYRTDPVACDEFDLYVMRRAGDLAPHERQRRRMLLTPDPAVLAARSRAP